MNICTIKNYLKIYPKNPFFLNVRNQACFKGCAQTPPEATPPKVKIHPFRKIPFMILLGYPLKVSKSVLNCPFWKHYLKLVELGNTVKPGEEEDD